MIYGVAVHGLEGETVIDDMDDERWPIPIGGAECLWVGGDFSLPDGTELTSGTGRSQLIFRQHLPEAATDPAWLGHKFEAVTTNSGLLHRYLFRAPERLRPLRTRAIGWPADRQRPPLALGGDGRRGRNFPPVDPTSGPAGWPIHYKIRKDPAGWAGSFLLPKADYLRTVRLGV